jgi:signal transduction histidine kinase/ligand-binding sensor domain-containing protein/DNA-binding response OmpR family regulator
LKKLLFIWICLLPVFGYSQTEKQITFSQLSVDDGLSQNSVVSIAQDSTGYLYFATQDGLNKYNGKEFIYYEKLFEDVTREDFSRLGKVYVAHTDELYIITKGGVLEKFVPQQNEFQEIDRFQNVSTLSMDLQRNLWIGTYGNGLYRIDQNKKDTLQILKGNDILSHSYAITSTNEEILIASSSGVISIHPQTYHYNILNTESNKKINFSSIAIDYNDDVWIGSYGNGLFYKEAFSENLTHFEGFGTAQKLPSNLNIEALLFDSKSRLWIGTYGDGAFLIDFFKKEISQFKTQQLNPKSIHYNDILAIHEDHTGNIWFGTDGTGVSFYDESLTKFNSITNYEIPYFANVDVTRAIAKTTDGTLWIGTSGKGLTSYHLGTNKFQTYKFDETKLNSIPSNRVMSLLGEDDRLWLGFQDKGIALLEKGKGFTSYDDSRYGFALGLTIWTIFKDASGRYWLGTRDNGLIQFDPKKGVVKQYVTRSGASSISSNNIRAITEGKSGELWIGTENKGVNKFLVDQEVFVPIDQPGIESVKSLYFYNELLWIGTNGNGLQLYETTTEKIHSYTQLDGLPNNVIYGILPDESNNLWLSSNRGISRFYIEAPGASANIVNYDTSDGLQALEFNTGASFKDNNGILYFGGLNGINWFNPSKLTSNTAPPKTIIYRLEVFNEEVPFLNTTAYAYNENTLSFTFAGLHYSQPERNQYKYFLENHDENWSKPNNYNIAHYTNLAPGDYTFKVISSNYDGVWSADPAIYSFTIRSPWYWTIWAKLGYIILVISVLYIVYMYLKSRWSMQVQLQLEYREKEKLKKLDELKTKLYTNISHEFRTPLTLISGPVNHLLSKSAMNTEDKKHLTLIKGNSERMLRLVDQLLELSQLEAGSIKLSVGNYDLKPQIIQLLESFSLQAAEKGITLKSAIDNFADAWYDRDAMEKIISNLLSNSIKYAPENSEISFKAINTENSLLLHVENEDPTLQHKDIHRLFDRFYQSDANADGVGIGLALIKELTTLSRGSISAEKTSEDRLAFQVKLPLIRDAYNEIFLIKESKIKAETPYAIETLKLNGEAKPVLLIVEDNAELRNYIVSLFDKEFIVLEAVNGHIGIQKAIKRIPDLIISDIMMPQKNGIELCNTLKQDQRTSHIPIILLTAKTGLLNELDGLNQKADDYITKPFHAEVLVLKVKNCISGRLALQKRYRQEVILQPKDVAVTPYDEKFLENIQVIVDTKIMNPEFNATDFAKELNLSRMQLHRKLKALTGLTTTEFLRSQRLKMSVGLLRSSDLTISEIAYTVGFNTPSYFIKCFKAAYNSTPADYVKE